MVVDTCILSSLAKIDRLKLLRQFYKSIFITPSVLKELEEIEVVGFEFVKVIKEAICFEIDEEVIRDKWILVLALKPNELDYAYKLKNKYKLSIADCECITVAILRKISLLSDDTYLGKIGLKEGIKQVFDLTMFLETCIFRKMITKEELETIIRMLKQKDYYEFSEEDINELFSCFK